jgi:flagellar export protein FliJ
MFRFRLQGILDVRRILEDKVLIDFSEHQKVLRNEKECLQTIQQQKMDLIDELRGIQGKTVNVSEITSHSLSIQRCQKSEEVQTERVREASDRADKKKVELLEAAKKRKAMEILKTHTFEKYLSENNLRERSAIDEMAIVRHKRREEE